MYDEREDKSEKKTRTFSFLYCLFNISFSTLKANGHVIKCSEIFNGYMIARKILSQQFSAISF
jgi:hypothetical protein